MPVTINASTSAGLIQTADTSGTIELQNNGTTRLTVGSSGVTIPTLNTATGVLATQNGMTGIAKAWVNFDGNTGSGNTIRSSFNISSITRNATGDFTINMTTALPDANYAVNVTASWTGNVNSSNTVGLLKDNTTAPTSSSFAIATTIASSAVATNSARISVAVFSS